MPGKGDGSPTWRGDMMRQIGVIRAELDRLTASKLPADKRAKRAKELEKHLAESMKKAFG